MQPKADPATLLQTQVNVSGVALQSKTVQLIDRFTGQATNLVFGGITPVDFTPTTNLNSTAADRFMIIINSNSTLPVNITRLAAREQQGNVVVEWNVAGESGVRHYQVEHSRDGREFTKAGLVLARNSGASAYSFIHRQPGSGYHYYRIRSEDMDGKTHYTQVAKVNIGTNLPGFEVYPTWVIGRSLTVVLNGLSRGRYEVKLLSVNGQIIKRTVIQHNGGSAAEQMELPALLASGNYIVHIEGEGVSFRQKIVKE